MTEVRFCYLIFLEAIKKQEFIDGYAQKLADAAVEGEIDADLLEELIDYAASMTSATSSSPVHRRLPVTKPRGAFPERVPG